MNKDKAVKIFVINLKRSVDRKKEMMRKFADYDIQYEFFEGVDGNLLPGEIIEKARARSDHWYHQDWGLEHSMKTGEIGVAMSHYRLYEKIISDSLPYAIIMEDDISFDFRFQQLIKSEIDILMDRFDLVLLGYCGYDLNFKEQGECSYWGRVKINKNIKAGIPVQWCWSAIGYIISNKGARLLRKKQGEIPCLVADILTANSPQYGVRLGVMRNKIVWPGDFNNYSTIHGNGNTNTEIKKIAAYHPVKPDLVLLLKKPIFFLKKFIQRQYLKVRKSHYLFISDRY